MTEQEKAELLSIALRAAGINVTTDTTKVILGLNKLVDRLGGSTSLSDVMKVVNDVEGE